MIRTTTLLLALALLAGCGGSGTPESGSATAAKTPSKSPAGADPSGSQLNSGPKAAASVKVNPGLADFGEQAFQKRACVTCHAIGQTKQGPDLTGVGYRRTEAWMTKQIKDPEWMVKNDPIARELMAKYALQMANQQVPDQEIKAIIHYLVRETLKSPETASK
jgi:mono/diheme cytochrome c family protein